MLSTPNTLSAKRLYVFLVSEMKTHSISIYHCSRGSWLYWGNIHKYCSLSNR